MDWNPYSKLMEIDNRTLTKMKYVLNDDGVWVPKDQMQAHVEEKHDEKEQNKMSVVMMNLKQCL
jgi:hypothetical protein